MGVAVLEKLYADVVRVLREAEQDTPLPEVDPNSTDLSDLFAWGRAVAERCNLTPEQSKKLLAMVRKHAKSGR
ncbi:MAG TPA: hypothetical protein GX507_08650 [Clostridia bacterium]|nr:hypothetical protein [Clostridia bacterium]